MSFSLRNYCKHSYSLPCIYLGESTSSGIKESKPNLKTIGPIWIIKLKFGQEMGQLALKNSTHQTQNQLYPAKGPNHFEHVLRKQNQINKNTNIPLETL